ncbi:AFR111Cp [Eremothecium gossypii ATCC 10895]|uniref:AFR111Cp n=1 Tax=Eremothecium gossypii (strain ATCC 10895 / CBS 109.51 / FGSC 9923 / NRRL Y-1056) TaxID=284811 RepID=Q754F9_EREGS|nr:AFR111Cp [Eremothecium gossypii ATCC 10895]AAS53482.2 AFR111Cp [Eremothecium gossypii ATCC 10895]AEY97794.1 FAFR111Cp [Eremothecium gossypii FDAG1]
MLPTGSQEDSANTNSATTAGGVTTSTGGALMSNGTASAKDTSSDMNVKEEEMGLDLPDDKENVATALGGELAAGQVLPDQPDLRIIHRKISGYVGFANLPKQWHRKSIRRGFNLNLLCVGAKGLGKSTLINTLFNKELYTAKDDTPEQFNALKLEDGEDGDESRAKDGENKVKIETVTTEIEENGVVLKLTVVDTPGFGDAIDNTDSWKPIVDEMNSRFDQYLDAENKINRTTIDDNRIHACLYFIEPTGHCLKPLDLEFCRQVHDKCNLIPVIAKSDILTDEEIEHFKWTIKKQLDDAKVHLFQPPQYLLDDEETQRATRQLFSKVPFAVVGSTHEVATSDGRTVRGRSYPWGIIEVDNEKHSDFVYLRDLLIRQYLEELRERTNNELYEKYRSEKLIRMGIKQDNSVFKEFDPELRQQEEKHLHEAKLAKLEAEMKAVFQQKVSEKEKKLQKSEAELFARHKEMKEKLMKQLKALEEKKHQLEMSLANQSSQSPAQPKKKGFLR